MRLLTILSESGLEEIQHIVEALLVAKSLGCVHHGRKKALYVGGMVV
jgi:hypothetical protein